LFFSAHGEGWALYSEQLADEMGVYADDHFGELGYLQSLLFRASRPGGRHRIAPQALEP